MHRMHAHTHTHTHAHMCVRASQCAHTSRPYSHLCIYIIYVCTRTYIYARTHTHTYQYTHISQPTAPCPLLFMAVWGLSSSNSPPLAFDKAFWGSSSLPLALDGVLGVELFKVGSAVGTKHSVPEGKVLAIVAGEVKVMLGMVGGAVDHSLLGEEESVVDGNGPAVDEDKHQDVGHLVDRKEKGVEVIGGALGESVDGVKCVGGPGGGYLPEVVNLVDGTIEDGVVKEAVNPIDAEVSKHEELEYVKQLREDAIC
mmetsp:Transcript_45787/g.114779  ORF Transcript_45787/g.114779 Transcript_45787/m.114779 type:complete len:255 (-) Transcript_45787:409-1173(-)